MIKEGPCSEKLLSCWKDETDGYKFGETQSKKIVAGIQSCCEKEKENCYGQKICQAADKPAPPPPVDSNQADIQLVYFYLKHGKYNGRRVILSQLYCNCNYKNISLPTSTYCHKKEKMILYC